MASKGTSSLVPLKKKKKVLVNSLFQDEANRLLELFHILLASGAVCTSSVMFLQGEDRNVVIY